MQLMKKLKRDEVRWNKYGDRKRSYYV